HSSRVRAASPAGRGEETTTTRPGADALRRSRPTCADRAGLVSSTTLSERYGHPHHAVWVICSAGKSVARLLSRSQFVGAVCPQPIGLVESEPVRTMRDPEPECS